MTLAVKGLVPAGEEGLFVAGVKGLVTAGEESLFVAGVKGLVAAGQEGLAAAAGDASAMMAADGHVRRDRSGGDEDPNGRHACR